MPSLGIMTFDNCFFPRQINLIWKNGVQMGVVLVL